MGEKSMPIVDARPLLAVLVKDEEMANKIPNQPNIQIFTKPSTKLLTDHNKIFVSVSLHDLPTVSSFVKQANDKNHLRSLLVRDVDGSNLLPQFLYRANLRTLRNLIVHSDITILPRMLNAYSIEAEQELIADARIVNNQLIVLNCAGDAYDVAIEDLKPLGIQTETDLRNFEIEEDGSYLYWPTLDIHLDIQSIREITDEIFREKSKIERLQSDKTFGQAITTFRKQNNLKQTDIQGLSARHIRRIENGANTKISSLKHFAKAHNLTLNTYLNELANMMQTIEK
jgi:hypothetical protein